MTGLIYRSPDNPYSHHTAMVRRMASFPLRWLFSHGHVAGRVLDFGCGQGADVRFLQEAGMDVTGYDPHFAPTLPQGRFDTILCTYVLNVLLPEEQSIVLMAVSELLASGGFACFSVRRDIAHSGYRIHAVHRTSVYQCQVRLPWPSLLRVDHCEVYGYRHLLPTERAVADCALCHPDKDTLITESARAFALRTSAGGEPAILVIPKTHSPSLTVLPARELSALEMVARRAQTLLYPLRPSHAWAVERREESQPHAHLRLSFRPLA